MSKIEWTNNTWNPITGCSKLSPGCAHCYAEVMTRRLQAMGQVKYQDGFEVVKFHEEALHLPATWKKPSMVFVNSMSDMFHGDLTPETLHQIFSVMNQCDWHTFQVLTKRSDRLREMAEYLTWTPNIWMGVSVENKRAKTRIDDLRQVGAAVRFLSVEPLLEDLGELNLAGIDWVVVGGESGPKARPMKEEWVLPILRQCQDEGVPFFFKQWGGRNKKAAGAELLGQKWYQWPTLPAAQPA